MDHLCEKSDISLAGTRMENEWGMPRPMHGIIPGSAIGCHQEMGSKLHWPVRPIQPIIPFPVVIILWPNRVDSRSVIGIFDLD